MSKWPKKIKILPDDNYEYARGRNETIDDCQAAFLKAVSVEKLTHMIFYNTNACILNWEVIDNLNKCEALAKSIRIKILSDLEIKEEGET